MAPNAQPRPLFHPGLVLATKAVTSACAHSYLSHCLRRHTYGDWGQVDADDRASNDDAVKRGERILSVYPRDPAQPDAEKVWILTEADRQVTTLMLAGEY